MLLGLCALLNDFRSTLFHRPGLPHSPPMYSTCLVLPAPSSPPTHAPSLPLSYIYLIMTYS